MPIIDIFSKRQKKLRGETVDVFQYDQIPNALRVQIVQILQQSLGNRELYHRFSIYQENVIGAYEAIVEALRREYGCFCLLNERVNDHQEELCKFLLQTADVEKVLDAIELSFRVINSGTRRYEYLGRPNASEDVDSAIAELNYRFKEHGLGYQFVESEILRIDSELLHVEAVKPALRLLNNSQFSGVQQEFLNAYSHYKDGNHKEALNECLKAFESMMKVICDKNRWSYPSNATANALIKVCLDHGLIPKFWEQNFTSLRSLLESSIPTGRNNLGGHGQGATPTIVPDYIVGYMLHMTASAIVFLGAANKS